MEHWINAARPVNLPWTPIPAVGILPMVLVLVWPREWTLVLMVVVVAWLSYLRMQGRTTKWIYRKFFHILRGGTVSARPLWYRRRVNRIETYDTLVLRPQTQRKN